MEFYSWWPSLAISGGADRGGEMICTQERENWDTDTSSLTEKNERRQYGGGGIT